MNRKIRIGAAGGTDPCYGNYDSYARYTSGE